MTICGFSDQSEMRPFHSGAFLFALLLAGGSIACQQSKPALSTPVSETPLQTGIRGRVTESRPTESVPIRGARIEVISGVRAGTIVFASENGEYALEGMNQLFTMNVSAPGYTSQAMPIDLSMKNIDTNIQLLPTPKTVTERFSFFSVPDPLHFTIHNPGVFVMSGVDESLCAICLWPTVTIELWRDYELVAQSSVRDLDVPGARAPLTVSVEGGAVYELRIQASIPLAIHSISFVVEHPN